MGGEGVGSAISVSSSSVELEYSSGSQLTCADATVCASLEIRFMAARLTLDRWKSTFSNEVSSLQGGFT